MPNLPTPGDFNPFNIAASIVGAGAKGIAKGAAKAAQKAKVNPIVSQEAKEKVDVSPLGQAQAVAPLGNIKATSEQIQAAVDTALSNSYKRTPPKSGESRHDLRARLQNVDKQGISDPQRQIKYDGSDVIVIAFEGTGAYEPRQTTIMQEAAELLADQGLELGPKSNLAGKATESIQSKEGRGDDTKRWSGLASGPLETLLENPELQNKSQWLSFPSEELEVLAGGEELKKFKAGDLLDTLKEAKNSYDGETPGINGALDAVQELVKQAKAQGKNPKIMVVSHSSGGRSSVKFFEKAKSLQGADGKPLNFVWQSIDPVREAHEAVMESANEFVNKSTEHNANKVREVGRSINEATVLGVKVFDLLVPDKVVEHRKVYPAKVSHRSQPKSLYKPGNVRRASNFYQKEDSLGLKLVDKKDLKGLKNLDRWKLEAMMFGIHGSPIQGVDDVPIHNVGEGGHGAIAYHSKVTSHFLSEMKTLMSEAAK